MRNLSVGRQQIVEILRAVKQNAKVLILDEPTSALTEKETEVLMQIMRTLHDGGVSIIYISHRLEEIFQICDTVTIMRDGQYIKTLQVSQTSKEELVKYMVGRDVVYQYGAGTSQIGEEVLRLENVCYKNHVKDVSLCLHAGEVLGLVYTARRAGSCIWTEKRSIFTPPAAPSGRSWPTSRRTGRTRGCFCGCRSRTICWLPTSTV